jgi:hypothetical protein
MKKTLRSACFVTRVVLLLRFLSRQEVIRRRAFMQQRGATARVILASSLGLRRPFPRSRARPRATAPKMGLRGVRVAPIRARAHRNGLARPARPAGRTTRSARAPASKWARVVSEVREPRDDAQFGDPIRVDSRGVRRRRADPRSRSAPARLPLGRKARRRIMSAISCDGGARASVNNDDGRVAPRR